jgi:Fur family ferric uptake transcriptional regulator
VALPRQAVPDLDGAAGPLAALIFSAGVDLGDQAVELIARDPMESRIERLCVERGLKMTGQRRVIARVLSEASDHPDVEELYRRSAALDARISIATVYRTVRLLEEKGILERRDFGGGRARYEPTEHGHHYHLIDIDTGKVIEFQHPEYERLMQTIAERLGFDLVSLRLELFGRKRDTATARDRAGRQRAPRRTAGSGQEGGSAPSLAGRGGREAESTGEPAIVHGRAEQ